MNLNGYWAGGTELQSISEYFNYDYEALWDETTVDISSDISVATPAQDYDQFVANTGFFIK